MSVTELYARHGLHLQETPYTCGPAALLNVLRLTGRDDRSDNRAG